MTRVFFAAAVLCSVMAPASGLRAADDTYPDKAIQIANMYAVGGGTDIIARAIGQQLTALWNVPVIVESRPGAGGTLAAAYVHRQPADGYSLLITDVSFSISAALYQNLSYDPLKGFTPVSLLNTVTQALVVNAALPVKTLPEFVAYTKAHPGQVLYASAGTGTPNHLAMEILKRRAGLDITHIPYKGAVAALADVVAGREQAYIGSLASELPQLAGGGLRALAVMGDKRSDLLPDVPSLAELGVANFDMGVWYGVLAPPGIDKAIANKLSDAMRATLQTPQLRKIMSTLGNEPIGGGPDDFAAFLSRDIVKWKDIVNTIGVTQNSD